MTHKNFMKRVAVLLFIVMASVGAKAQNPLPVELIPFQVCPRELAVQLLGIAPWNDPILPDDPRGPEQPLPSVAFDGEEMEITLFSEDAGSVTVFILSSDGDILTNEVAAYGPGADASISVASFEPDTYTIILQAGSTYYIGSFTVLEEE